MTMATRRTRKTPRGKTRSLRGGVDERTLLYVTFFCALFVEGEFFGKRHRLLNGKGLTQWMTFDDDDERLLKIPLKRLVPREHRRVRRVLLFLLLHRFFFSLSFLLLLLLLLVVRKSSLSPVVLWGDDVSIARRSFDRARSEPKKAFSSSKTRRLSSTSSFGWSRVVSVFTDSRTNIYIYTSKNQCTFLQPPNP